MSEKHEGKSVCLSVQMLKDAVNVFLTHCISHRLWWIRRAAPVLSCPVCVPNARSLKQKPLTCVFMGASIQGGHLKLYRHHHHHGQQHTHGREAHYLDHQNKHSGYCVDTKECSQLAQSLLGILSSYHMIVGKSVRLDLCQGKKRWGEGVWGLTPKLSRGKNYLCSTLQRANTEIDKLRTDKDIEVIKYTATKFQQHRCLNMLFSFFQLS